MEIIFRTPRKVLKVFNFKNGITEKEKKAADEYFNGSIVSFAMIFKEGTKPQAILNSFQKLAMAMTTSKVRPPKEIDKMIIIVKPTLAKKS